MEISRTLTRILAGIGLSAALAIVVLAQSPGSSLSSPPSTVPPGAGELNLQTNVGSFRVTGTRDPAHGRLEIDFTGSVLISDLAGSISASQGLIKEYDDQGRKVYFGTGKLVIEGKFRKFQWFGRDMQARFVGAGIFLLFGEFDKNLETGTFWYSDASKRLPWGHGGNTVPIPNEGAKVINPVERGKTGGGGG